MQANQAWIAMFRRIPANLQDSLALGLRTGQEIVVQKIIRLDPDFMIVRGRLSGTQDMGRILLIPYPELTYVALTQMLKDPEIEAVFGKGAPPAVADFRPENAEIGNAMAETPPEAPPAEDAAETEAATPAKRPETQSKASLLAKLRERLKGGGGAGT